MYQHSCWEILGIEATTEIKVIKKAYAKRSKEIHPEDHPEEFMQLHDAYEQAMAFAKHQDIQSSFVSSDIIEKTPKEINEESNEFDFDALFEEATYLNQKQTESLRISVLEKISILLKKMTSYTKWLEFTQEPDFIYIAEDSKFINNLYHLISKRTISSEANTAFYKFYTEVEKPSKDIKKLLNLLNQQMENRRAKTNKNLHKICVIVAIAVALFLIYLSWLWKSRVPLYCMAIFAILFIYLSLVSKNKIKEIKAPTLAILTFVFIIFFAIIDVYVLGNNTSSSLSQVIQERYGDQVTFIEEVDTDNPFYQDVSIYKCYDEENDFTFYVKESLDENGKSIFEDTLSGAFVSSLNINFTVHQKDIYPVNRMYDNVEGFDIKVTAENGDAMAKELYLLVQKVCVSPFYDQCKDFRFYAIPEDAKFAHYTRYSKTIEELSTLNVKEIKDWMFFSITAYHLDFTLWHPEKYQEDVQQYLHDASGIDILGKHYSDVHVENDKLSIGNFYRLAIHLDLNIQKKNDDSLVWYTKNTTQILGSGVSTPYIDVSLVKDLL